jgi:hypothetical protein
VPSSEPLILMRGLARFQDSLALKRVNPARPPAITQKRCRLNLHHNNTRRRTRPFFLMYHRALWKVAPMHSLIAMQRWRCRIIRRWARPILQMYRRALWRAKLVQPLIATQKQHQPNVHLPNAPGNTWLTQGHPIGSTAMRRWLIVRGGDPQQEAHPGWG